MPGARLLFCLALFVGSITTVASAQEGSSESVDAEAHALFEAGRSAYGDARYDDALGYFQHAYALSHRPELLFNIGQCQDRLRHDAEAVAAFREFASQLPESAQRTEVERRIAILEQAIASHTPAVTPPPEDTPPPPAPAHHDVDPAPWIVLGVGAAVAIAGAVLLGVGYADIATVDGANGVTFASVHDAYESSPVFTGIGWAALGVGVAMAAGGLVWALTGGGPSSEHARLHIGPSGLALSGAF